MTSGVVFDIKEFAVNDGPGVRFTVFLKGCPLRCQWCHNPEGLSFEPQFNKRSGVEVGKMFSVDELVERLCKFQDLFTLSGGGVTFSGGEPLAQSDFLFSVAKKLQGKIHLTLDTSGFCEPEIFDEALGLFDLFLFDLKLQNNHQHEKFTGQQNVKIIRNLKKLAQKKIRYHIRIPLIPTITDTKKNLEETASFILSLRNKPETIDLLPYNKLAGGKYDSYDMTYPLNKIKSENNLPEIDVFIRRLTDFKVILHGGKNA